MNRFAKVSLISLTTFIAACSKGSGGGGSGAASISGADYTGNYRLSDVECYSTSGTLTATAQFATSSPNENIAITGNSITTQDTGTCSTSAAGTVVFTPSAGTSAAGNIDITSQTATTSAGSCSLVFTLTSMSGGTITPSSLSSTETNGQKLADVHGGYIRNASTGSIGLFTSLQVSGRPTDLCFAVYLKL